MVNQHLKEKCIAQLIKVLGTAGWRAQVLALNNTQEGTSSVAHPKK
jgi:hypothetical protein